MNKFILLAPFLLLLLTGIASASPTSVPSGITHYVPVNLTNSQTAATPAPFQQMVSINESTYSSYINYNSNFANFEYFYANGTLIPSWIESNSSGKLITWVKIAGGIPASSKLTVYLGFAAKTTNLLSNSGTSGIGEAPQLSSTYAEYDDGASVFNNYWNFAGTSLPSGLNEYNVGGTATYTFNNGFTLITSSAGNGGYSIYSTAQFNAPMVVDFYGYIGAETSGGYSAQGFGFGMGPQGANEGTQPSNNAGFSASSGSSTYSIFGSSSSISTNQGTTESVWTAVLATSTTGSGFLNYGTPTNGTITAVSSYNVGLGTQNNVNDSFMQWLRTRAYPPNGVMPSVTFGAVVKVPSLTISPNPSTYGQSVTLTATCPIGDSCAIDYPSLGTAIATGTGTATYTWNTTKEGIGTFSSFYAVDTAASANSTPQSLTTYVPINIYYANATSSEIHKTLTTSGLYLIPACTNNAASLSLGYCIGNMVYSASTTLQGNIYVFGNITIDSGVTITENGHYLYATGRFDNLGTITGGNNPNAPGGAGSTSTSANGGAGTSITTSYAGSGAGGGGGADSGSNGGSGGSTLAAGGAYGATTTTNGDPGGSASTPSAPTMSPSLAESMFANATKYLASASGAGGGAGNGDIAGGNGAAGVFGVAIGGNKVIAGTINTNGNAGAAGASGTYGGGGGGGSGAAAILIVYNSSYTAGTYSYNGGSGGAGGTGSDYSGGSGGAGGSGQVITYSTSLSSLVSLQTNYYYPLKYNASTTSNMINFNVSIFKNGITAYQSSNQSFSYLPSLTADYLLSFKEHQGTAPPVYLNTSFVFNTTTINSSFTFNSYSDSCIQFYPCLAETPTWTARPSTWSIIVANELLTNQHTANTSAGAQFDSPNLQVNFANAIKLNYPFTSFYLNLTNNPKVQTSITQAPFKTIASGRTSPAAPYTRVLNNITGYLESSYKNIAANFTLVSSYSINNYTFANSTSATGNTIKVYVPQSTYQNPVITQVTPSIVGTATAITTYSSVNSYCSTHIPSLEPYNYSIYMVNNSGSLYSFTVYRGYSQTLTGTYVDVYQGIEQSDAKNVQSFKIASNPFSIPLQNGYPYSFKFFNCTSTIYQTNFSVWGNPITLYLPVNISVPTFKMANVTAACSVQPYVSNQIEIVCNGTDTTKLVKYWKIDVYNITSVLSSSLVANVTLNGSSFTYTYAPARNGSQYNVRVLAYTGFPPDYTISVLSFYNSQVFGILPSVASNSWIALLLIFSGIAIGSRSPAFSLIFETIVLILLPLFNIASVPVALIYGIVVMATLGAFIVAKRYTYGS